MSTPRALACVLVACVALASSTGCSLLKLTVLKGPGCCENAGEEVAPVGPLEQRAIVRASLVVEAPTHVAVGPAAPADLEPPPTSSASPPAFVESPQPPVLVVGPPPPAPVVVVAPPPPPPTVLVTPPPRADVRLACSLEERAAWERVESTTVEYGAVERLVLGFWVLGAGAFAVGIGGAALREDEEVPSRVAAGVVAGALAADAAATAALALFHPEVVHRSTGERVGAWRPRADGCPAGLVVRAGGVAMPALPDGTLSPFDALRVAHAVWNGGIVEVSTASGETAPLAFAVQHTEIGTAAEGIAVLAR